MSCSAEDKYHNEYLKKLEKSLEALWENHRVLLARIQALEEADTHGEFDGEFDDSYRGYKAVADSWAEAVDKHKERRGG